jgi:hypothetical protein
MKKFAVLVFCINSLEVTSMIFSSIRKGLKKVEELTGQKMEKVVEDDRVKYELNLYEEFNKSKDKDYPMKFFTRYYSGCGQAGYMVLKEVEEGKPFCEWDLD